MLLRAALLAIVPLLSASAFAQSNTYLLSAASTYESGCHAPCECPILLHAPLAGSFRLTFTGSDPLYEHYTVTNLSFVLDGHAISGSGTYRRGGEVALQQQLVLELDDNGDASHFDSGLVPVGAAFPLIVIDINNQVDDGCYYTAMHLEASQQCSADFNGDGDVGTDQDIEAFFACLSGRCCFTCESSDFNGDGDFGTDADIESFFRVLAGGAC